MQKITPFLWYDGQAEEAARFYVSLLPDSRIDRVTRSPADTPTRYARRASCGERSTSEGARARDGWRAG